MSRIGKLPVSIPTGVTVAVDGNTVKVKGPKGELAHRLPSGITVDKTDAAINVKRASDETNHKALHGLTRSLIHNMMDGVTKGYRKQLEITGVGRHQADRPAADADRDRRRRQGARRAGRGRVARPASPGAVQGQGNSLLR